MSLRKFVHSYSTVCESCFTEKYECTRTISGEIPFCNLERKVFVSLYLNIQDQEGIININLKEFARVYLIEQVFAISHQVCHYMYTKKRSYSRN